MNIKPVRIDLKRNDDFTSIALILDRDDFLKDIYDLRRNLNIKNIFPINFTLDILIDIYHSNKYLLHKGYKPSKKNMPLFSEFKNRFPLFSYFLATDFLTKKYNLGIHHHEILTQALLSNRVVGYIFPRKYYVILDSDSSFRRKDLAINFEMEINTKGNSKAAIVFDSRTTKEEVIKMFNEAKKELPFVKDTVSNIRRDRMWYWENRQGKSAAKIQDEYSKEISIKGIEKAINQYKKLISYQIDKFPPTLKVQ